MIIKMVEGHNHTDDQEEILQLVRKYNMRLNPATGSFGVQAGKILGFMLARIGIEANLEKCHAVIDMKSATNVKEM